MSFLIGFLLALTTDIGLRRFGLDRDRAIYPAVLTTVATYDVVFAIAGGSTIAVMFEVAVLLLLVAVMIIGFRTSLWWIVGGLAAHGLLDAFHGELIVNQGIPAWWPPFCATYDLTIAVALARTLVIPGGFPARLRPSGGAFLGIAAAVTLLVSANVRALMAQGQAPERARASVSLGVIQTRPAGALGDNIGLGYGATATLLLPLNRSGSLSFRADIGAAEYGHDERRTQFSESVGGRVEVDVRTVNTIVPGSVGVQWTLPAGPFRPYVNTGLGAQVFYTESRVEPTGGGYALASTINQSDIALSWTFGGGVNLPVSRKVQLDLAGQFSRGGRAEYLASGSIADLPGGRISITPLESVTHLLMLRVGARIGL